MGTHLRHLSLIMLLPLLALASWEMDFDELWASAGGAFNPLSIEDCHLWLDASDAATVLHTSGAVTNWLDKSTAGNNAVAIGAAGTRPTACPAEQNGLCTISFDGGDYLATNYKSVDGQTVFVVAQDSVPGGACMGARDSINTRSMIYVRTATTGDNIWGVALGTSVAIYGSTSFAKYGLLSWAYDGSIVYGWANGEEEIDRSQYGTGANTTQGYYFGTFNNQGSAYLTPGMIGNIAEVIIYKRVLTDAERGQVESYLMTKWGL